MNPHTKWLAAIVLLLAPGAVSAQFVSGINTPFFRAGIFPGGYPIPNPIPALNQAFNPVQLPRGLGFSTGIISASGNFGPFSAPFASRNISIGGLNFSRQVNSSYSTYSRFYDRVPYRYYATYRTYIPGYTSGSNAAAPFKAPAINQNAIGVAQMQRMEMVEPRKQLFDQWAYEKIGVQGLKDPALKEVPPELAKALAATDELDVVSGDVLNHILVASLALEKKGVKGAGAALPPELVSKIVFGGSPSAEALNTLRQAGSLPFPPLFASDKMRVAKDDIEKDFAAVALSAGTGKAVDQGRVARLTDSVQRARDKVAPVSRDMPFEEAIAARRFLNDLDVVAKVLRDGSMAGIINPFWATEGTTVPDLIRHMAKYKLLFGHAPKDGAAAEAYVALQKGLAAYHASLSQQPIKK